ncbi:MAG: glycosyltransferase family 2 protein [Flavisolibacter sp.]
MQFSIIIPTFNRASFIRVTVNSILNQTVKDFEIIIVDDDSTDGTEEVIRTNFGNLIEVKYFRKENEERGAARNFGMRKAKGDYVVFLDSDDRMKTNYLEILSGLINKHQPLYLATRYKFHDGKGHEWSSSMRSINEGWYGRELFLKGNSLACNFCVRLNNPDLHYFPEERELASMEDWLFLLLNINGNKIYIGEQTGVLMLEHSGRSMSNNRKIIEARNKATEWAIEKINLSKRDKNILTAYSHYFCGIHEYLEGRKKAAIHQSIMAMKQEGMKAEFIQLFIKSIIGKRFIERLKPS